MKQLLILIALLCWGGQLFAESLPAKAFTNVTIHYADGSVDEGATIVWRGDRIQDAGTDVSAPFDARVFDGGDSLHVYPGFIDGYSHLGSPGRSRDWDDVDDPGNPGYYRAGIWPDKAPKEHLESDQQVYIAAQQLGFTTASIGLEGYMLPGKLQLFELHGADTPDYMIRNFIAHGASLRGAGGVYPNTLMGVLAQYRQLWNDVEAHYEHQRLYADEPGNFDDPGHNEVLEALYPVHQQEKPFFFEADSPEDIDRVIDLQDKLRFDMVLVSAKRAAERAESLAQNDIEVLVSFDLPDKPSFMEEDEDDEADNSEELTEEEEHYNQRRAEAWEERVRNLRTLMDAGVDVGFASAGLDWGEWNTAIATLLEYGMAEEELLSLLTIDTAGILGIDSNHGDLQSGNKASFSVMSGSFTDEETEVIHFISGGTKHEL